MFLNKLDEAIKNYDLAISQAPKAKFYIEKGRIFNKQGKNNEEIQTYLEGLEKSHKDSFYLELTKITGNYYYARTKEFDKSINIYKKGIENFPEDYILYEKLIKAFHQFFIKIDHFRMGDQHLVIGFFDTIVATPI